MTHADRYRQLLLTAASFAFLAVPSAPALSQAPVLPVVEPEISAEIPPQGTAPGTQVMPSVPMTGAPLTPEQQIAPAESESANAAPSAQAPGMLQPDANVGVVDHAAAKQSTQASGTFEAMDPKSLEDLKNSLKNMQMVRGATESQLLALGHKAPGIHQERIDTSSLPAGLYTVVIRSATGDQGVKRLMVQ